MGLSVVSVQVQIRNPSISREIDLFWVRRSKMDENIRVLLFIVLTNIARTKELPPCLNLTVYVKHPAFTLLPFLCVRARLLLLIAPNYYEPTHMIVVGWEGVKWLTRNLLICSLTDTKCVCCPLRCLHLVRYHRKDLENFKFLKDQTSS